MDAIHLCGGLRITNLDEDWWLGPLCHDGKIVKQSIGKLDNFPSVAALIGCSPIGWDEVDISDNLLKHDNWKAFEIDNGERVDRLWSDASRHFHKTGNAKLGDIARNISNGLRSSASKLKECSNGYNQQLMAVLGREHSGLRFSNTQLNGLLSNIAALSQNLCFVRDQVSHAMAVIAGDLPEGTDDWARLQSAINKKKFGSLASQECNSLYQELLLADQNSSSNPWLAQLSKFRKTWTHKSHIVGSPADSPMISVVPFVFQSHQMAAIRIPIRCRIKNAEVDALEVFNYFWLQIARVARCLFLALKVEVAPLVITEADLVSPPTVQTSGT